MPWIEPFLATILFLISVDQIPSAMSLRIRGFCTQMKSPASVRRVPMLELIGSKLHTRTCIPMEQKSAEHDAITNRSLTCAHLPIRSLNKSHHSLLPRICEVDAVGIGASNSALRNPCLAMRALVAAQSQRPECCVLGLSGCAKSH